MALPEFTDLGFTIDGHIATLEIQRPPHNYLDIELIDSIANALKYIDDFATTATQPRMVGQRPPVSEALIG